MSGVEYKPIDVNFNFIRSLFLDRVLYNPILYSAFLENKIENMAQLESFNKVSYTDRFKQLLDKLQAQVKQKRVESDRLKDQTILDPEIGRAQQPRVIDSVGVNPSKDSDKIKEPSLVQKVSSEDSDSQMTHLK